MEWLTTALANRDVFTTIITLWIFTWIVIPLINKQNTQIKESLKEIVFELKKFNETFSNHMLDDAKQLTNIFNALEEHRDEAHREFNQIKENSLKTILNKEQTISLLKTNMWYVTAKKLDFIKAIILNNHIANNGEKIREKVYNWLMALSDEYLTSFSTYHTPIWDLSKWMTENFWLKEFNKLVDDCVDIIYKVYDWKESDNTLNKINEIWMTMKTLQVWLANKLRADLNKI